MHKLCLHFGKKMDNLHFCFNKKMYVTEYVKRAHLTSRLILK